MGRKHRGGKRAQRFVLPQLITAAQDMWHSGSSTWFDRTADLRVLLNGGAAPAEDPNAKYAEGTPAPQNFTPAAWARGAGNWLNRDDSESVTAYGRDYQYNLNRDLETVDFQSGIDLGKRGLLSENDILVFGLSAASSIQTSTMTPSTASSASTADRSAAMPPI